MAVVAPGWLWPDIAPARREILTQEQKAQLRGVERVLVEAIALTDRGGRDAGGIAEVVAIRLADLGYAVVRDPQQPHDVTVRAKCEERKTWEGPITSGGDADLPGAASRLWRGPACQLTYRLAHRPMDWRHEVRTGFEDPLDAAQAAGVEDSGQHALAKLTDRLREDPFPFLLAAEWGHTERLLQALDAERTEPARTVTVIGLLGRMFAVEAIPRLGQAVKNAEPAVAESAAIAIGRIGSEEGVRVLLDVLKNGNPSLRAAAVKGLGRLAPLHPQIDIVPALLEVLPGEPIAVKAEIVRALSRTTDRRALGPLRELDKSIQALRGPEVTPAVEELKKQLGILLDQYDGVHNVEY